MMSLALAGTPAGMRADDPLASPESVGFSSAGFRIASMIKPLAGVAMMMLWEQGKWTLDDPVARHIPEFAGLKVATAGGEVPQAKPMTMRQLMSHTAGGMMQNQDGSRPDRGSPQVRALSRKLALVDPRK